MIKKRIIALLLSAALITLSLSACSAPYEFFQNAFSEDPDETAELVNAVTRESVRSTVFVSVTSRATVSNPGGSFIQTTVSGGSGVIYDEDNVFLYCLTNAHVVEPDGNNASILSVSVKDYKGTEHTASIVYSDAYYDLAVIRFTKKTPNEFSPIPLSNREPQAGDTVVAVSSPDGQLNAITVGRIEGMAKLRLDFEVLCHTAWLAEGSSGSVLLNKEREIVGINFAITFLEDNREHLRSYAVPRARINEFLNEHELYF